MEMFPGRRLTEEVIKIISVLSNRPQMEDILQRVIPILVLVRQMSGCLNLIVMGVFPGKRFMGEVILKKHIQFNKPQMEGIS